MRWACVWWPRAWRPRRRTTSCCRWAATSCRATTSRARCRPMRCGTGRRRPAPSTRPCRSPHRCWAACERQAWASAVARLHRALDLALAFAVLDGVALVVLGLALGQRDLALHAAVLPVQVEGHQRVALLLDLDREALDLLLVQQQLLGAHGVGVHVRGGRLERIDLAADHEHLAIAHDDVAVGQLHL